MVAVWTKNLVTDTDRYVATVAPLASDPAIQSAIADRITAEIFKHLDVAGITNRAVDALADRGLPPLVATQLHALSEPLSSGVESFVRTEVGKVVASDAFVNAWTTANWTAHQALVAALTGETRKVSRLRTTTVSIQPWSNHPGGQTAADRQGVWAGESHPQRQPLIRPCPIRLHRESSRCFQSAQCGWKLATRRGCSSWRSVSMSPKVIAAHSWVSDLALLAEWWCLALRSPFFARSTSMSFRWVFDPRCRSRFYDTLVRFLRLGLRTVLVFGLVIALAGSSLAAPSLRSGSGRGAQWYWLAAGRCRAAGFRTGPVGAWVYSTRRCCGSL